MMKIRSLVLIMIMSRMVGGTDLMKMTILMVALIRLVMMKMFLQKGWGEFKVVSTP